LCYNNNVYKYNDCAEILSHELIHAYDYCRANIDIENNYHIACSEVINEHLGFHMQDKEDVAIMNFLGDLFNKLDYFFKVRAANLTSCSIFDAIANDAAYFKFKGSHKVNLF